jgi:predicted Zn-dependent protease with MMP-like domain
LETKSIFVGFTVPPSLEDIQQTAEAIIADLPQGLHKYVSKLKVTVEDFPDDFITQELEVETPFDLLGCYQSAGPAALGHLAGNTKRQDTICLYRRPILDAWSETSEDLTRLINRIILTEIGHHFGFSDDDMQMYEEDMFGATALNIGAG